MIPPPVNEPDEPIDNGWWELLDEIDRAHESEHGPGGHE